MSLQGLSWLLPTFSATTSRKATKSAGEHNTATSSIPIHIRLDDFPARGSAQLDRVPPARMPFDRDDFDEKLDNEIGIEPARSEITLASRRREDGV